MERTLWPSRDGDSSFWGTGLSNVGLFSERPEDMANPFVNYSGLGWWWHTPWATLDRGDSNILARDAKANVNFIFHLCNCPILPMDFLHYVDEIQRILEDLQEKLDIAKQLEKLGVDVIEAGFPISSPGDFEAVSLIAREVRNSTICGLARANPKDVDRAWEAVQEAKHPRIHVFVSSV